MIAREKAEVESSLRTTLVYDFYSSNNYHERGDDEESY